jgi:DNA processing protein
MSNDDLDAYHLHFWLTLALTPGLGARRARSLVDAVGARRDLRALAALLAARDPGLSLGLLSPPAQVRRQIEAALDWSAAPAHHLVSVDHPAYPEALAQQADAPLVLHVAGDPAVLGLASLAIVGSRNASRDGTELARSIAAELAGHGWSIVSGLASGIDVAAHLGALDRTGLTVAVIGTGIDRCYPESHQRIAQRVAEHGAVVSELPIGAPPLAQHFPLRNRLIAGLARGVLVVQAARRSGSLITARLALEYGREVMAIPGSVHTPLHKGCHQLIREGALLIESAADVLEALNGPAQALLAGFDAAAPQGLGAATGAGIEADARAGPAADAADERLLASLGWSPIPIDAIDDGVETDPADRSMRLLELELCGRLIRLADGRLQRVR